ncbi:MAG: hypothetical protein JWM04_1741 [Verrucomicrobiales bacterium]|nr:hypothetical protein [Verrucomicrobiales bacterium]
MRISETKFYKPLLIGLALLLLVGVSNVQKMLNVTREKVGITRIAPLENAPPLLAFTTVALGGFRGLIANVLWMRANDLQDQDKYFEMVQLADWITKLEPRIPMVWKYLAWNQAYNISVKFPDPAERWRWVNRGISLLRDDGIRYNPEATELYWEIAWIYQHKMGQDLDDAQVFYKQSWTKEMTEVLGYTRPNYSELLDPKTPEQIERVRKLKTVYKLDPAKMKALDDMYGPLEWRLPEAHAIYWATEGLRHHPKNDEIVTFNRVIYQSMDMAFKRGALIDDPVAGGFVLGPNLDMADRAWATYEGVLKGATNDPPFLPTIKTGQKNFLANVPYFMYLYNRNTEAKKWFDLLKKTYPELLSDPSITVEDYTADKVMTEAGESDRDKVVAILNGMLVKAYVNLAAGEDDRANNYQQIARRVWERFQKKIGPAGLKRVGLEPLEKLQADMVKRLLDPQSGLSPEYSKTLRTRLKLPAASTTPPSQAPPPASAPGK